jgi:membrane-bound serine protease (ClpP class)
MPLSAECGTDLSRLRGAAAVAVALAVLLCRASLSPAAADDPQAAERLGMAIRVELPITDRTVRRVEHFVDQALDKARREQKRPVLIFEFRVPKDQEKFAGRTEFTDALELARLLTSERLASEQTVAYVPSSLPGHAVLVAMACEDILMPGEAQLGPVGIPPEAIGKTERIAYAEIADRRKTIPTEVALWLLDPSREVLVVQTEAGRQCVTPQQLETLRKTERTILSEQPLREWVEGQPGQLSGDEAWRLDIVSYKPAKRQDVAGLLELPPEAINEDPSLIQQWRAVQVSLKGPIRPGMVTQTIRLIKDQVRLGEKNFVCLWINSPGGSLTDSIRLADFLANDPDLDRIRTVAYVPKEARSDAVLIALACDQVVMHPQAELGGTSDYGLSEEDVKYAREMIHDENGPWKSRPWALVAAMIDPDLAVFSCRRAGQVEGEVKYLTDKETRQLDAEKWTIGREITRPGEPLVVNAQQAIEYRLANLAAETLHELQEHYDLEELTLLEPGWADLVIELLKKPGVDAFLLMVAFLGLYFELHTPGVGVGGFLATVCFALFFWIKFDGETATLLEVILFLAGIACLLLEIFVLPGFGIFGLGGGCLVLVSLILASQTYVLPQNIGELQRSVLPVFVAMLGVVIAAMVLERWLPRAPILSQMLLEPPAGEEAEEISRRESLVDLDGFVGTRGTTTTQLTPSGKARFGDMLVDVITDGDVVPRGTPIEVVEVRGNRVLVRALEKK